MAPIRRYLLLPPSILLETRIYIDPPSLAQSWLLHRTDPALPSIIDAIRPLVIPKLREETERARGKGAKGRRKGGVKDTVVGDGFEVGIFLRDDGGGRGGSGGGGGGGGGYSVMRKMKTFQERGRRMRGNGGKLTGFSKDEAVVVRGEDSEEEGVGLQNVPSAAGVEISDDEEDAEVEDEVQREGSGSVQDDSEQIEMDASASEKSRGGRRVMEEEAAGGEYVPPATSRTAKKRRKKPHMGDAEDGEEDDKKKLGFNTTYAGYSVHGRILCLIVTQTGKDRMGIGGTAAGTGQAMMEDWIASTQAPPEEG